MRSRMCVEIYVVLEVIHVVLVVKHVVLEVKHVVLEDKPVVLAYYIHNTLLDICCVGVLHTQHTFKHMLC